MSKYKHVLVIFKKPWFFGFFKSVFSLSVSNWVRTSVWLKKGRIGFQLFRITDPSLVQRQILTFSISFTFKKIKRYDFLASNSDWEVELSFFLILAFLVFKMKVFACWTLIQSWRRLYSLKLVCMVLAAHSLISTSVTS